MKVKQLRKNIFNFFTKGNQRSIEAKKNIIGTIAVKGISIIISLLIVPVTIHYINSTQYGIWITLSSIIGWFSFFDIGFGNGLRNKFTENVTQGNHEQARIYVSTTYAIMIIIIGVVLVLFFCINPFLNWAKILNTPQEMANELSLLAIIVFSFFCIQFVLQLITTIITANQQPAKASFLYFLSSLLSLTIIFILTKTTSGNLIYLGIVYGLSPVLILLLSSVWYYRTKYKNYAPSIRFVHFKSAFDLMSLGLKFFLIQIAAIIFYQTSNIIIAQLFGPEQVTPYNIAYKYFSVVPMFFGIILTPFWSAFTEAWSQNDLKWIKRIIKKLIQLWCVLVVIALIMLLFSNFVYRIWVGKEIVVSISLTLAIALYVIVNAWNNIFSHFLNGVGKIKLQLYISLVGSILNIPLAVFLGRTLGIYGIILSTTLISLVASVVTPIQYQKIINKKAHGIWAK